MPRPPRPTRLKVLAGDQDRFINFDEPQPDDGIPQCPHTDPLVIEVWNYTVAQLKRMQVITMADRDVLVAFCEAVALHRRASEIIAKEGMFLTIDGLPIPRVAHPAVKAQREAAALIKSLGGEFGLTPSARSRIKVGDQQLPGAEKTPGRLLTG